MLDLIATQSQLVQDSTGPHCFPTQKYVVSLQRRGSIPWHDRNPSAERRRIVGGLTKARCSSHLEHMSRFVSWTVIVMAESASHKLVRQRMYADMIRSRADHISGYSCLQGITSTRTLGTVMPYLLTTAKVNSTRIREVLTAAGSSRDVVICLQTTIWLDQRPWYLQGHLTTQNVFIAEIGSMFCIINETAALGQERHRTLRRLARNKDHSRDSGTSLRSIISFHALKFQFADLVDTAVDGYLQRCVFVTYQAVKAAIVGTVTGREASHRRRIDQ
ncbi:hypothetical protein KCU89_g45, partial [Aureobasidium melanogenum]